MKNKLDQFYTNPKICDEIVSRLSKMFFDFEQFHFIEPSAGSGNFIDSLVKQKVNLNNIEAYDIQPKSHSHIKESDYLKTNIKFNKNNFVIGNPPFGKNGILAVEFINKALSEANIVCFILPSIFKRYSVQKQIKPSAKLIFEMPLPKDSFLVNDRKYDVNTIVQIWTNENFVTFLSNFRLKNPVSSDFPDLQIFIHNNTQQTLKFFDKQKYQWDFAVVRQGYYDYSDKITDASKLFKNRQYMFFKTDNKELQKIINQIDFVKLSKTNTTVPGFSKSDVIKAIFDAYYNKIFI